MILRISNKISSTEDENLLLLLKTDYEDFTQNEGKDVADELSDEDKQSVDYPGE